MMAGAIIGTIAIVLIAVAVGVWLDRRAPILPRPEDLSPDAARKKQASHGAGEAPATALHIKAGQLAKLRTSQRCPECRALMQAAPDEHVRYNHADLLVSHFACPKCSGKRTIYIDVRGT